MESLQSCLQSFITNHVMLAVDDMLLFSPIDMRYSPLAYLNVNHDHGRGALSQLGADASIFCCHLKLHPGVVYSHPSSSACLPPNLTAPRNDFGSSMYLKFPLRASNAGDWNYSLDFCGGVYRVSDIHTLMRMVTETLGDRMFIRGPNELEAMFNEAYRQSTFTNAHKHSICPAKPVCWVVTVNRVQTTYDVPIYTSEMNQSVDALNKYLEEGMENDMLRYASLLSMSVPVGEVFVRRVERAPLAKLYRSLLSSYLVSVILPVYNDTKYVAECVKSILEGESECSYEIIVIDDGSEEDVTSVLQMIKVDDDDDQRIKYVRTEHVGIIGALEVGLEMARSEFVARIDADDVSLPNRLSRQLHFLVNNPTIHVVGSQAILMPETFSDGHLPPLDLAIATMPTHPMLVAYSMLFRCSVLHPTAMFRKRSVMSCGSYSGAKGTYAECIEDFALWVRLLRR